jgi:hypothetical protein
MIFVKKEAGKEGGKVESEDAIGKFSVLIIDGHKRGVEGGMTWELPIEN